MSILEKLLNSFDRFFMGKKIINLPETLEIVKIEPLETKIKPLTSAKGAVGKLSPEVKTDEVTPKPKRRNNYRGRGKKQKKNNENI
jgi:hypothetical protein